MAIAKLYEQFSATATTTDATPTVPSGATYTITSGAVVRISTSIIAKTGSLSGAAFEYVGTFKNTAGTVTQIGSTSVLHAHNDTALNAIAITYNISGTAVRIQVTGIAATTIEWEIRAFINVC